MRTTSIRRTASAFAQTPPVAIGVAVIAQTSQAAFDALNIIGAAYLIYLA
ncbi:hypothetical protein [Mesorhizobium sp.]|nr:hypothetical protein [Mesorhizobium sp.]